MTKAQLIEALRIATRTATQKREDVRQAIRRNPVASDREIADECLVTHTFVGVCRRQFVKQGKLPLSAARPYKAGLRVRGPY